MDRGLGIERIRDILQLAKRRRRRPCRCNAGDRLEPGVVQVTIVEIPIGDMFDPLGVEHQVRAPTHGPLSVNGRVLPVCQRGQVPRFSSGVYTCPSMLSTILTSTAVHWRGSPPCCDNRTTASRKSMPMSSDPGSSHRRGIGGPWAVSYRRNVLGMDVNQPTEAIRGQRLIELEWVFRINYPSARSRISCTIRSNSGSPCRELRSPSWVM